MDYRDIGFMMIGVVLGMMVAVWYCNAVFGAII
jgi:hypothetical protein